MFGFGSTTPAFGTQPATGTAPTAFGSFTTPSTTAPNPFAATTTTPSTPGNVFGTPAPTFGSTTFGSPSAFGGTSTTTSTTGTGSIWGAPSTTTPATSTFGTTSPFGGMTPQQQQQQQAGTVGIKFQPVRVVEANQTFYYQCITANKNLENKSLEELRWEDYQIKMRGGVAPTSTTTTPATTTPNPFGGITSSTTPFGATTPSSTGFGTTPTSTTTTTPAFGASTSGFGTGTFGFGNTSSTFGTQPSTTPSTTSNPFSFGSSGTTPTTSAFGTTPFGATTSTTQTPATSTFGQFGSTPSTTTSAFGTSTFGSGLGSTTTSTWGSPQRTGTTTSAFGGTTTTPAFGSTTFGSTQQSPFGATTPSTTTTQPAFGSITTPSTTSTTTSLFPGTTSTTTTQPFGATSTTPAFGFGTTGTTPSSAFSSTTGGRTSLTSASTSVPAPSFSSTTTFGTPGFGTPSSSLVTSPTSTGFGLGGTQFQTGTQQPSTGFGFGGTTTTTSTPGWSSTPGWGTPSTGLTFGQQAQGSQAPLYATIDQNPFVVIPKILKDQPEKQAVPSTPSAKTGAASVPRPIVAYSHYKIAPRSVTKLPRGGLLSTEDSTDKAKQMFVARTTAVKKLIIEPSQDDTSSPLLNREARQKLSSGLASTISTPSHVHIDRAGSPPPPASQISIPLSTPSSTVRKVSDESPPSTPAPPKSPTQVQEVRPMPRRPQVRYSSTSPNPRAPILTKPDYSTEPSIEELQYMTDEELAAVQDFTVHHKDAGSVTFEGKTDVRDLNLDEIVQFANHTISVYPNEDDKPPEGQGLNKPAIVTLYVRPKEKRGRPISQADIHKFEQKLRKTTAKFDGEFISYDYGTGAWTFRVKHFSRYGLADSDDSDSDSDEETKDSTDSRRRAQQPVRRGTQPLGQPQPRRPIAKRVGQPPVSALQDKSKAAPPTSSILELRPDELSDSEEAADMPHSLSRRDESMESDEAVMEEEYEEEYEDEIEDDSHQVREQPYAYEDEDHYGESVDEEEYEGGYEEEEYADEQEMAPAPPPTWPISRELALNPTKLQLMHEAFSTDFEHAKQSPHGLRAPVARPQMPAGPAIPPSPSSISSDGESPAKRLRSSERFGTPPALTYRPLPSVGITPSAPGTPLRSAVETPAKPLTEIRPTSVVPLYESVAAEKIGKASVDAGLLLGRSFRVGWAPGGLLIHCGRPIGKKPSETPVKVKKEPPSVTKIHIERVEIAPGLTVKDHYLPFLSAHLKQSTRRSSNLGPLPTFSVDEKVDDNILENIKILQNINKNIQLPEPLALSVSQHLAVWKLVKALWGKLNTRLVYEPGDTVEHILRRVEVSQYLQKSLLSSLRQDLAKLEANKELDLTSRVFESIFLNLTALRIPEAVELALSIGEHRLALLLAQATSPTVLQQSVKEQLDVWKQNGVLDKIPKSKLKVYRLLAGDVDVTSGLTDWRRVFGVHLWFGTPSNSPVDAAVRSYAYATLNSPEVAAPPRTPYDKTNSGKGYNDAIFEILMLYDRCETKFKLMGTDGGNQDDANEREFIVGALHPLSSHPYLLDYRLGWHLYSAFCGLKKFSRLQLPELAQLTMSYASQLEAVGLWEWAVYVILNAPANDALANELRALAVREIVSRHIGELLADGSGATEKEHFLVETLGIPVMWLHEFKSYYYRSLRDPNNEVQHLLRSQQWDSAHHVVITHLAPLMFLRSPAQFDETTTDVWPPGLKDMLLQLRAKSDHIMDWEYGGRVFLDFFTLAQEIVDVTAATKDLVEQPNPPSESVRSLINRLTLCDKLCAQLGERLASWGADLERVNSRPDPSFARHPVPLRRRTPDTNLINERVCIAEMSTRIAGFIRSIKALKSLLAGIPETDLEGISSSLQLATSMTMLPIPQNHRLSHLDHLTSQFLALRCSANV